MLKLIKVLLKQLSCCHLLSARCVRSFQTKHLLKMFPFLSNKCRETGNISTGTDIVNPCIPFYPEQCLFIIVTYTANPTNI